MTKDNRSNIWIDDKIQGALVRRLVIYWVVAWASILGLTLLATSSYSLILSEFSAGEVLRQTLGVLSLPLLMSVVILPIVIRDYARLSHRFCGPMMKFQIAIEQLAEGKTPDRIVLRDNDYWQELADNLNRFVASHASSNEAVAQVPAVESSEEALVGSAG